jgi:hypothetical protein
VTDQRGTAPVELAAGLALLVLPAAFLVLSFGPLLETRAFLRVAAAQGAELLIRTDGDVVRAQSLLADLAGSASRDLRVSWCGGPFGPVDGPPLSGCGYPLPRGGLVEVAVEADVSAPLGSLTVGWRHVTPIDVYHSR